MTKKPKNLNKNSNRQFLLQQRDMIDQLLKEVPELTKSDLLEIMPDYEESLRINEFAPKTKESYLRVARKFIKDYSSDEMPVDKENVIEWKSDMLNKYAISTINNYITSLNRFLFFCDLDELKVSDVKSQNENVLASRIYDHEYKRMWMRAKKMNNMQIYFAIKLMGEIGVRVDEIQSFTGVTVQETYVKVINKQKERKVPIPQDLRYELRKYAKENEIVNEPIVRLTYSQINRGIKAVAGQCKINVKKVNPHAFRHYFGFRFVSRKGDQTLAQLSDIMGHSSVETTRIYTRGTLEDYQKTLEELK